MLAITSHVIFCPKTPTRKWAVVRTKRTIEVMNTRPTPLERCTHTHKKRPGQTPVNKTSNNTEIDVRHEARGSSGSSAKIVIVAVCRSFPTTAAHEPKGEAEHDDQDQTRHADVDVEPKTQKVKEIKKMDSIQVSNSVFFLVTDIDRIDLCSSGGR